MNINDTISREETDRILIDFKGTQKAMTIYSNLYRIFLSVFSLIVLFIILLYGLYAKHGYFILTGTFIAVVTLVWWKRHFKRKKERKQMVYLKETAKILNNPQEYNVRTDEEKAVVNDTVTICFNDVKVVTFINGYVLISSEDKKTIIIPTDDQQQLWYYDYFNNSKTLIYLGFIKSKEGFVNKTLLNKFAEDKKISLKKSNKEEITLAGKVTLAVSICMAVICFINSKSARDKTEYRYNLQAKEYFISQMAEKYSESKSYKALLDIYFDWASQNPKSIVAVKKENGVTTEIKIYYKNKQNAAYTAQYINNPENQTRSTVTELVTDWKEEIRKLSNYQYLAENYPYTIDVVSVLGIDMEAVLKDNSFFTFEDRVFVIFTPAFYSCGNENEEYVIYFSDKYIENEEYVGYYFDNLQKECEKPYDDRKISHYDIGYNIELWTGIDVKT